MNAAVPLASRPGCDWQVSLPRFARSHADLAGDSRARLYKEVQF
jgi:hypothetical protein